MSIEKIISVYEKDTITKMLDIMKSDKNVGGVSPIIWCDPIKKNIFMSTPYLRWDGSLDQDLSFRKIIPSR